MEKVTSPRFVVVYSGKDITQDITRYLISVSYSDRTEGESDEIELQLEDSEGKWRDPWYPSKGDKVELSIGYDGTMLDCGTFTVDEVEMQGPPDTFTIRALAAGVNSPMRTKRSKAHEDATLRQIAEEVAGRHNLTIEDGTARTSRIRVDFSEDRKELTAAAAAGRAALAANIPEVYARTINTHYTALLLTADSLTQKNKTEEATEIRQTVALWRAAWAAQALPDVQTSRQTVLNFAARLDAIAASLKDVDTTVTRSKLDVKVARSTQDREDDLAFLKRISAQYGVLFSVRGDKLIFTSMYDIETAASTITLNRGDLIRYSMKDKTTKTYTKAKVSYHLPSEKKTIAIEVDHSTLQGIGEQSVGTDTLLISQRVESEAQAQEIAKAALYRANSKTAEGSIELPGRPMLVAGINIVLAGLGVMSGTWHVEESQHRIDKGGGYVTSATLKRVAK